MKRFLACVIVGVMLVSSCNVFAENDVRTFTPIILPEMYDTTSKVFQNRTEAVAAVFLELLVEEGMDNSDWLFGASYKPCFMGRYNGDVVLIYSDSEGKCICAFYYVIKNKIEYVRIDSDFSLITTENWKGLCDEGYAYKVDGYEWTEKLISTLQSLL